MPDYDVTFCDSAEDTDSGCEAGTFDTVLAVAGWIVSFALVGIAVGIILSSTL